MAATTNEVATRRPSAAPKAHALLRRETFSTSRLLDFFSQKELTAQVGHEPDVWQVVVLKELTDNSLDACEDQGIAPQICVTVDEGGIAVADNGPGIEAETIRGILDFSVRVSSREAYVSPTRGAQGNAMKCLVAMPYVLDSQRGSMEIISRGVHYAIAVRVDPISQKPIIDCIPTTNELVPNGTVVKVLWPNSASELGRPSIFPGKMKPTPLIIISLGIDYPKRYTTSGPGRSYGALLFVEKEGFFAVFDKINLSERYDIGVLSPKGLSNTAARKLIDAICGG
jgi:hypothetical protein